MTQFPLNVWHILKQGTLYPLPNLTWWVVNIKLGSTYRLEAQTLVLGELSPKILYMTDRATQRKETYPPKVPHKNYLIREGLTNGKQAHYQNRTEVLGRRMFYSHRYLCYKAQEHHWDSLHKIKKWLTKGQQETLPNYEMMLQKQMNSNSSLYSDFLWDKKKQFLATKDSRQLPWQHSSQIG